MRTSGRLYPPVMAVFMYTGISHEAFLILIVLMLFDSLTGFIKVAVTGQNPTSRSFAKGIYTKLAGLLLVFAIAIGTKIITGVDMSQAVTGIVGALSLNELYSIVANYYTIKTGEEVEEYDAITGMLKSFLAKIRSLGKQ